MEHNGNENMPPPTLCRMGCGFYGNASTDGMCSKCHRDALKRKQNSSPISGRASPAGEMDRVSSVTATLSQTNLGASNLSSAVPTTSASSIVSKTSVSDISSSHCSSSSSSSSVETATPTVTVTTSSQGKDETTEEDGATADCASSSSSDDVKLSESDKKPKKNRCNTCRKKVGLTGFLCRCGGLYCSLHRYSDKHSCTFDYKEMAQEQIRKNNPVIVGEKIKKI